MVLNEADFGVAYCGPGTVWDSVDKLCTPQSPPVTVPTAAPAKKWRDKVCKPFHKGISYDGPTTGTQDNVLSPTECAETCMTRFDSEFFTFEPATRKCDCRNSARAVHDPPTPRCAISKSPPHVGVNVTCGGTFLKRFAYLSTDADGHLAARKDEEALRACEKMAAGKKWGACPSHTSGESCNLDVGTHCDERTTVLSGDKCIAKAADPSLFCGTGTVKQGAKCVAQRRDDPCDGTTAHMRDGRCVANPVTASALGQFFVLGGKCTDAVTHSTVESASVSECRDACARDADCVASAHAQKSGRCNLYSHCGKVEPSRAGDTLSFKSSAPKAAAHAS